MINCKFTNNRATDDYSFGGAVCFESNGNITSCNIINVSVDRNGGAIWLSFRTVSSGMPIADGKTTFKIKNLTKKGTLKAKVKYAGNAYYNAVAKKVKINR